jgi:hypothetical protein
VSWVLCPIIPAIVALVLASSAAREIASSQGAVEGSGLVTASRIISWINIGLFAFVIVVGLIAIIVVGASGGMR